MHLLRPDHVVQTRFQPMPGFQLQRELHRPIRDAYHRILVVLEAVKPPMKYTQRIILAHCGLSSQACSTPGLSREF